MRAERKKAEKTRASKVPKALSIHFAFINHSASEEEREMERW